MSRAKEIATELRKKNIVANRVTVLEGEVESLKDLVKVLLDQVAAIQALVEEAIGEQL